MLQDIERVEYRGGMLEDGRTPYNLPVTSWKGSKIPSELLKQIREDDILNCGGTHGDPSVGDPIQYDCLTIYLTDDTVKVEFYNRAISILCSNDEQLKKIFHVMSTLESLRRKKRSK